MGVPRVWEKIMERIQEVAAQSGFIRRKMLLWAMSVTLEQNLTCPSRYRGLGVSRLRRHQGRAETPGHRLGSDSPDLSRPLCRGPINGWA